MNTEELSYLAGFIDGEGCISISKTHRKIYAPYRQGYFSYDISLVIGSTNKHIIRWIQGMIGVGYIHYRKPAEKRKEFFTWTIVGRQAASLLEDLLPYLRIKQKVAMLCIDFQSLKQEQNLVRLRTPRKEKGYAVTSDEVLEKREWYYQQSREFNRRGQ